MKRLILFLIVIFSVSGTAFANTCNCIPSALVAPNVYKGTGSTVPCTCVGGTSSSSPFCGDSTCSTGENATNCCQDCHGTPACGDGNCCIAAGESCSNCPADCGACPYCGDGTCSAGENVTNCCQDCHGTPACGDGKCCAAAGERCSTCPQDCGVCSGGGCFLAGTPIVMSDGSTRPIKQVREGNTILAYDDETKQLKPDRVTKSFKHISDGYLIINGHLKVTPNHPVYSNGQWAEIGKLREGDQLLNAKGQLETIISKEWVPGKVKTYNLEVNPFHTYIAGGYVVHNKVSGGQVN